MAVNKDEFLAKMKQQFEELNQRWYSERSKFETKAKQSTAEARKKLEAEWEELGRLRKQMREKIIDLEVAGENTWDKIKDGAGDAWEDLRGGTESAWGALSEAFKKAVSRFK
jgi:predicted  nucleic acid-binding Zn-ribbon protein